MNVKPSGPAGDFKCDGRQISTSTVFQCYGPGKVPARKLKMKINADFNGARHYWPNRQMKRWVFVHNNAIGLPPEVVQQIEALQESYPDICIELWGKPELLALQEKLTLPQLEELFGFAPSRSGTDSLGMADLQPVIEELQSLDPLPANRSIEPPSVEKLSRNSLSEEATALLQLGRRKESLVALYFEKHLRPNLGERIAESFRKNYTRLRDDGLTPDKVYTELLRIAGGSNVTTPKRQGAINAVLSYFFERCDIFEN